ncbi:uncharacterized protein LOC113232150 [Hyposmocoma kahamanoa]|uniref:uncharacterized protein LOC113232150 n=1 Tax=Hyposmocoma kahamanoa TaxID=1477025 RepID=UPI000E6D78A4|nr:uncharacterized protein LOC113232150 [Hyposmocoma kahamanoa]
MYDTVKLETTDASNASIDSTNDNIKLENILSDNIINIPKDIHSEADTSLNTEAKDAPMDIDIADSLENIKEAPENIDESTEPDSKIPEKPENLQTEQGIVSDVNMSQDISMDLGSKEHGLKHPNMMIEIPTQELINIDSIMDNTSDVSVTSEDKNCEDIASLVDNIQSKNKENYIVIEKFTDNVPQANSTETESDDLTGIEISEGNVTFQGFEVKGGIYSDDKIDSDVPIEIPKETDTTQPVDSLSKDVESSPLLKVEHCCSVSASVEPSLSMPSSEMEPLQAPTESLPSTSQVSFLSNEASVSKEPPVSYQPSTSNHTHMSMAPDTSDEIPEVSDSLGLLAESSRVMEDDEEQETSDHDDVDYDDDYDPDDESSNQMIVDNSEDSNAQHLETELPLKMTHQIIEKQSDDAQYILEAQIGDGACDIEIKELVEIAQSVDKGDNEGNEVPDFNFDISSVVSEVQDGKDSATTNQSGVDITENEPSKDVAVETPEITHVTTVAESIEDNQEQPAKSTEENDTETEKISDISANEDSVPPTKNLILRALLNEERKEPQFKGEVDKSKQSPSKTKKLEVSQPKHVENIVDLEESSSEDDIPDVPKDAKTPETTTKDSDKTDVTSDTTNANKDITNTEIDITNADIDITDTNIDVEITNADVEITNADIDITNTEIDITNADVDITDTNMDEVTSVNLPSDIDIMSYSGINMSQITTKHGEIVISGVPRPPPQKPARLNTSEVSIKTVATTESTLVIPEKKVKGSSNTKVSETMEVFNLDSDDEDTKSAEDTSQQQTNKCVNNLCKSDSSTPFMVADSSTLTYYGGSGNKKKRAMVCQNCLFVVAKRQQSLIEGIRNFTPLLELDMGRISSEFVEISDSDSEEGDDDTGGDKEVIGKEGARMLEEKLVSMLNESWEKYNLDARLKETQDELNMKLETLEKESAEIDAMLNECQIATDKLRNDLYATFKEETRELDAVVILDTPEATYSCTENAEKFGNESTHRKRSLSSATEVPAKRTAIPLGYKPLEDKQMQHTIQKSSQKPKAPPPSVTDSKIDDDKDVSVVHLSAEAAPADLPPSGDIVHPPLRVGMAIFAMRNAFGSWLKAKIAEVLPKAVQQSQSFTMCKVKFESKNHKNAYKILSARCLAYAEPASVRLTIGTRVIALFKDKNTVLREAFYSGVVAEMPNPVNKYRYLVFFDDGYAQYVHHVDTRLVSESCPLVWEEVHPFSREFVKEYLLAYPERPMVRLHTGQSLKAEWNGKWWSCRVLEVDASLVKVLFETDGRREWIYRGSTRLAPLYLELQAAERHRARPMPRNRLQNKPNMPYVEYTRSDEQEAAKVIAEAENKAQQEEIRRQRAVAKKSTTPASQPAPQPQPGNLDNVTSRVVYYTPKNAVKPHKMVPHTCSPKCKRTDVLALGDLRTYNPLAKPLLSGWERQITRMRGYKEVMYRAPCGRRLRNMQELHRYLRYINSEMGVDLFDFTPSTHCLAEFVLNKCIVGKKDLSHGKENVPVPCVNYYDDSLPEFCSYNTERTPTAGVPLNIDPEFLCGCDCTDDCEDKSKCACWKMTLEGARTIGLDVRKVGYVYKRLPEPLPSGIYECNSRCKCKSTCLNRVAQHPLQLKLQVFKTLNRGWGIRALNDVPKGSFLCVYAGNLLTDATANLDGLNEGDEYLAELDYIEVVEQMKEGFEEDIPDTDKELDKKESGKSGKKNTETSEEEEESSEDDEQNKEEQKDGDFEPGFIGLGLTEFNKRLRIRDKKKDDKKEDTKDENKEDKKEEIKEEKDAASESKEKKDKDSNEDDCITISDDEEGVCTIDVGLKVFDISYIY